MSHKYVAKYLRISEDDEDMGQEKKESSSIANQRKMLDSYIANHEEISRYPTKEFIDDGVSGVNFHRPAVQKMLKEVRENKIFCIVVKDFSRFGRNYIEVGDYIEQIFPFLGVRFISVSDHFDSSKNPLGLDIGFKNLIHDFYSRDLSRKVKSAIMIRQKRGMYNGGGVPFGYKLSEGEDKTFVLDEEAAKIVKKIFGLAADGNTTSEIADILNKEVVSTPGVYKKQHMGIPYQFKNEKRNLWTAAQVNIIIRNDVYRGSYVVHKVSMIRPGKVKKNDRSEYMILENHHERLVEEELFQKAQNITTRRKEMKNSRKVEYSSALKGKVKCGCCGYGMSIRRDAKVPYYRCCMGKGCGSYTKINVELLEAIVWNVLQKFIETYHEQKKALQNERMQMLSTITKAREEKRTLEIKLEHCRVSRLALYYQWKEELLTKEEYIVQKDEFTMQEAECQKKLEILNQYLAENLPIQNMAEQKSGLVALAEKQGLTEELVDGLIERIEVYNDERVEIKWKVRDVIE